jgi:hypothetical protein
LKYKDTKTLQNAGIFYWGKQAINEKTVSWYMPSYVKEGEPPSFDTPGKGDPPSGFIWWAALC